MKPTPERIIQLNRGTTEAKNLMETLAIDFHVLIPTVFPDIHLPAFPEKTGITKKMLSSAQTLYAHSGFAIFDLLKNHPSDTLRGIACHIIGLHKFPFEQKLVLIQPLADDHNSGVREWAWMALRPEVIMQPLNAVHILQSWTTHTSDNVRRFASEITRPRGVWCAHIREFRQQPWLAIALLESLKNDSARYVQRSVGNWLNDAGKDHPDWVKQVCHTWQRETSSSHTRTICKRALRNLS